MTFDTEAFETGFDLAYAGTESASTELELLTPVGAANWDGWKA